MLLQKLYCVLGFNGFSNINKYMEECVRGNAASQIGQNTVDIILSLPVFSVQ